MRDFQRAAKEFLWVEIDLGNLRHNLLEIRRVLGKSGAEILAVVKADAYGHGMKEVAQALWRDGVRFFGVANIQEALALRRVCPGSTILTLGSFHESQIPFYIRGKIRPTLSSAEDLEILEKKLKTRLAFPVHVKVDTGMGRLGVWHEEAIGLVQRINGCDKIKIEGIYTHFAGDDGAIDSPDRRAGIKGSQPGDDGAIDSPDRRAGIKGATRLQITLFARLAKKIKALGIRPKYWHAANSLGLARFRSAHLNMVRPGILLYGLNPLSIGKIPLKLKPVLSLKTRISFLKKVPAGRSLSYGGTHQTSNKTCIATLPVGYSHGYRTNFSNKGFVLVNGKRCSVVGRVTMDQTLVDVGRSFLARRWDPVTLIGHEGNQRVSVEELARFAGTIPYEIVCSIHSRIPRFYKK